MNLSYLLLVPAAFVVVPFCVEFVRAVFARTTPVPAVVEFQPVKFPTHLRIFRGD